MNRNEAITLILSSHSNYKDCWDEYIDDSGCEDLGICSDMIPYSGYIIELVDKEIDYELTVVSNVIEQMILKGDDDVKYGVKLGLLEGLTGRLLTRRPQIVRSFVSKLGPKTRVFCQELDDFWGTDTPGVKSA